MLESLDMTGRIFSRRFRKSREIYAAGRPRRRAEIGIYSALDAVDDDAEQPPYCHHDDYKFLRFIFILHIVATTQAITATGCRRR